ncbi:MAG TPA: malto-oligosyltrehalose synthase [Candidatus Dormibacteraeota bacterium]|nr:malto-oligosyltrehalose synthase [Candidatus Dormibacteraeota bacterium]
MRAVTLAPRATYRVQLRPGFGFEEAASLAPYLAELGISHLYASPILEAVPGSPHGYDLTDPTRIRGDLGGPHGFRRMVDALHAAGLGLLVDIVPNHMSTDARYDGWWADVLELGPRSAYAGFFDVEWDPPWPELRDRVLLPVLDGSLDEVAARGGLGLERSAGRVWLTYGDQRFPVDPATLPDEDGALRRVAADPAALVTLCDRQHWLLAPWTDASTRLNHRRFFTITSLVGVREEEPRAFDAVHGCIAELVRAGSIDGLRVDHVDGLRDPARYLARLREATGAGWVVVEKILEEDEELPAGWPADGTTGYEFAALLTELSVDPAGAAPLTELHAGFTGYTESFDHCVRQARLALLRGELAADVTRLAARLTRVAGDAGPTPRYDVDEAAEALVAVIAELGVYRTYVDPQTGSCRPEDAARAGIAVTRARRRNRRVRGDLLDLVADCLCGRCPGEGLELVAGVQQLTPAVMAKAKEDTALYRWNRLLALNEVGADPDRFGLGVDAFHAACARWAVRSDRGLRATSTHDTKRSEDVRARLCVLSEMPGAWAAAVRRWSAAAAPIRPDLVDPDTEYVLYQTLVGAHPIGADRLTAYLAKATREAALHTSWTRPDAAYDEALRRFAVGVLEDAGLMSEVEEFARPVAAAGMRISLAWTLLKVAVPGVPDVYQGTELWDLSLVDPDNRRPVDFDERRRLLAGAPGDRSAKLRLLARALGVRRELEGAFGPGAAYTPLAVTGPHAGRVVAFSRGEPAAVVCVADRRGLEPAGGWGETAVALPHGSWVDRLTDSATPAAGGEVAVAGLLHSLPGALLTRS